MHDESGCGFPLEARCASRQHPPAPPGFCVVVCACHGLWCTGFAAGAPRQHPKALHGPIGKRLWPKAGARGHLEKVCAFAQCAEGSTLGRYEFARFKLPRPGEIVTPDLPNESRCLVELEENLVDVSPLVRLHN